MLQMPCRVRAWARYVGQDITSELTNNLTAVRSCEWLLLSCSCSMVSHDEFKLVYLFCNISTTLINGFFSGSLDFTFYIYLMFFYIFRGKNTVFFVLSYANDVTHISFRFHCTNMLHLSDCHLTNFLVPALSPTHAEKMLFSAFDCVNHKHSLHHFDRTEFCFLIELGSVTIRVESK